MVKPRKSRQIDQSMAVEEGLCVWEEEVESFYDEHWWDDWGDSQELLQYLKEYNVK